MQLEKVVTSQEDIEKVPLEIRDPKALIKLLKAEKALWQTYCRYLELPNVIKQLEDEVKSIRRVTEKEYNRKLDCSYNLVKEE